MRKALAWVTEEFFQDRLMMEAAQKVSQSIREHYPALNLYLPLNLTLKLANKDITANSLLYSSSSEYLRERIRRECRDMKRKIFFLNDLSFEIFEPIHQFITRGETSDLYRFERKDLIKILNIAMLWELEELSTACQNQIKNYITRENMFEVVIKAHLKRRGVLRNACFDYINSYKLGFRLENRGLEALTFEFIDFNENSKEAFEKLREFITHLVCSGKLTEEEDFAKVVVGCPYLICLDISRSRSFSEHFKSIPESLQELEAGACQWMNDEALKALITQCPNLTRFVLTSDVSITFEGWGSLNKLEQLHVLDLTRCSQVRDEELLIILQAAKDLVNLSLEECRAITDIGFLDLPNYNSQFTHLNLARTAISDQPLIELASKCPELITLNLTRCDNITSIGAIEFVRNAPKLKELNLTSCDISRITLKEIGKIRPFLKIIH
jgi:hypothetical protein